MFSFKDKKVILMLLIIAFIICLPPSAFAAFDSLTKAGKDIFTGLRKIIYPASAVGIIAVCMGGFFGNINWKWLTAIVVGLVVISSVVMFVDMFAPDAAKSIPADVMGGN
ncbi:MAG: TrbC/VirB2 family protein [Acetobacter sp.]|nr:TrbC/VirB2 family protein [Acetobacter sp.]